MKKTAIILYLLILPMAQAFEYVNFSFQFGTSTLLVDEERTQGFGWSFTGELYVDDQSGLLLNYGNSTTEATDVTIHDQEVERLTVVNRYLQAGPFFFPFKGLRVGAGGSFHRVEQELKMQNSTEEDSGNFGGPFFNISYTLPIERLLLGAQYNYVSFAEYSQSDLFFMLGLSF